MSQALVAPVTLMYDGWQVWDGVFGPVRVGGDVVASVEFVQRSALTTVETGSRPHIEHLTENRYLATALVLDTSDAVVLDLGALRALRWVRPGETPGDFETGTTAALEITLSLNGWTDTPWTNRAAKLYGTDHRWRVDRIVRKTIGVEGAQDIEEAAIETVDSAHQFCLLECTRIE
jgi:hypothetical protein